MVESGDEEPVQVHGVQGKGGGSTFSACMTDESAAAFPVPGQLGFRLKVSQEVRAQDSALVWT